MSGPSCIASELVRASPLPLLLNPPQCLSLLQSYAQSRSLNKAKQLHAIIVSSGLCRQDQLLSSRLSSAYALCGDIVGARHLFDQITPKTPFLWNTLIRGYTQDGLPLRGLHLFELMVSSGRDWPDKYTFTFALKACADMGVRNVGAQVHCKVVIAGFGSDGYVQNSLVTMYMRSGNQAEALEVFERMPDKSAVSCNSVISGLVENGCAGEALGVFDWMLSEGIEPELVTAVSVLPACASLKDLRKGRLVHAIAIKRNFEPCITLRNAMIDMYAKCRILDEARSVFDDVRYERDVVSWTSMIGGYALDGHVGEALSLCFYMQLSGIKPNAVTMASLLSSCVHSDSFIHGRCIHGLCVRLCLATQVIVETALVDMYGRCGNMALSSMVFVMSSKRTATWNAIISCHYQNGMAREAIEYAKLMLIDAISPNATTFMSVLPAYAESLDSQLAGNIHGYLVKTGFDRMAEVATALIDVYAKIGSLKTARKLFDVLHTKDIVTWSTIIAGYGMHGHARTAIELFDHMLESGIEPNEVTFTSLLYSCSHAGLVDEGLCYIKNMAYQHPTKLGPDHYSCIIDLLGRAGRLSEAHGLIRGMPFQPNPAVWGAFLGACVIHGNIELGEEAAKQLFELEPENTGNYVLLCNLYAAVGRWEDMELVRSMLNERGLRKQPGCSLIESRNSSPCLKEESKLMESTLKRRLQLGSG